tara:strand:- start:3990 stop:4169 length:180 start_codon:yes stop_codon:yes gene_type:complete
VEVDKILTYAFAKPLLKQQIIENPDDFTAEEILIFVLEALRGGTESQNSERSSPNTEHE